jgi:cysteinyl-tRNA synthetase
MRSTIGMVLLAAMFGAAGCTGVQAPGGDPSTPGGGSPPGPQASPAGSPAEATPAPSTVDRPRWTVDGWVYQLQNYDGDRLDAIAKAPQQLAVIDLARDAKADWFRPAELAALHRSGKIVLAYFEIGSIERFRPEYPQTKDLSLNVWADWPEESFVRYWDERWWSLAVRPRVDRAIAAGFDGVYLDTPLAYEEIDLKLVPGEDRGRLARKMAALIGRISKYGKEKKTGFRIVPQNSPELREQPGYTAAIDGIAMEELFFGADDAAADRPCTEDYCAENLGHTRALRDAGKLVLAVDYAVRPANVRAACGRYRTERFTGYVTVRELDRISPPCA